MIITLNNYYYIEIKLIYIIVFYNIFNNFAKNIILFNK